MEEPLLHDPPTHRSATNQNASHTEPRDPYLVSGTLSDTGSIVNDPEAVLQSDKHHAPAKLVGWGITTAILLADMFGLGALTLPADMARLGWAPGVGAILLAGLGMAYTGVLFQRLACNLPRTGRFDDFGYAAYGRWGRWAVYVAVYGAIFGEPTVFQITCVESLKQIVATTLGTTSAWTSNLLLGAVVAAIMWPLSQLQGLEEVGWISIFGTVGMLVASAVVLVKLMLLPMADKGSTHVVEHSTSIGEKLVALMDIIFAFGGQINWMRYLQSMKYPRHFGRSVRSAGSFMMIMFLSTAGMGYYKLGNKFDLTVPITSLLRQDGWSILANAGVFLHCIIAYQINLNVWSAMFLNILAPTTLTHTRLLRSRLLWFVTNTMGVLLAFFVGYLFPFFSTVLAIVAALGDVGGAYVLPILFNLKLFSRGMPRWEVRLCWVLLPLTTVLTCVGLYSSIRVLLQQFGHAGASQQLLLRHFMSGLFLHL